MLAHELYTEQDERDIDLALLDAARNSTLGFTTYTKPDYRINWHHRRLAYALDRFVFLDPAYQYLMVFMPPRHGKSEKVSRRLPAFIHGKYPDDQIMAVSYLDTLASDMTVAVQNIMDSEEYKRVFPNVEIWPQGTSYTKGVRNSTEHHIKGQQGRYMGQGVGGSFTGRGANWIIIDDPIKGREIADSVAFRERLWNFYNNDLFSRLETRLDTGRQGRILITLTRWHEDDLAGRLLELQKKDKNAVQWKIVDFPAIREDMDNPDDPREIGEALWPQKYNTDQLAKIRTTVGTRAWTSLFQQKPVPSEGNLFKDSMFKFQGMPDKFDYMFIQADTAYEEKKENDFHCFTLFGVIADQIYIPDVWMEQIKATDVENVCGPWIKKKIKYGYRGTWIEPKGHGIYLNQNWRSKGFMIPSQENLEAFYKDRKYDKVERANNAVPHLANRFVIINEALANKEQLVAQCLGFPKVKHDDFVDTLVDGIKNVYGRVVGILDVL